MLKLVPKQLSRVDYASQQLQGWLLARALDPAQPSAAPLTAELRSELKLALATLRTARDGSSARSSLAPRPLAGSSWYRAGARCSRPTTTRSASCSSTG